MNKSDYLHHLLLIPARSIRPPPARQERGGEEDKASPGDGRHHGLPPPTQTFKVDSRVAVAQLAVAVEQINFEGGPEPAPLLQAANPLLPHLTVHRGVGRVFQLVTPSARGAGGETVALILS